jgi:hypothetical protein
LKKCRAKDKKKAWDAIIPSLQFILTSFYLLFRKLAYKFFKIFWPPKNDRSRSILTQGRRLSKFFICHIDCAPAIGPGQKRCKFTILKKVAYFVYKKNIFPHGADENRSQADSFVIPDALNL